MSKTLFDSMYLLLTASDRWDVEAKEQTLFPGDDFLEKRRSYLKGIVGPLGGWAGNSM